MDEWLHPTHIYWFNYSPTPQSLLITEKMGPDVKLVPAIHELIFVLRKHAPEWQVLTNTIYNSIQFPSPIYDWEHYIWQNNGFVVALLANNIERPPQSFSVFSDFIFRDETWKWCQGMNNEFHSHKRSNVITRPYSNISIAIMARTSNYIQRKLRLSLPIHLWHIG